MKIALQGKLRLQVVKTFFCSDYDLSVTAGIRKSLLFHREGLYLVVVEDLTEELPDVICQDDESSLKTKPKP